MIFAYLSLWKKSKPTEPCSSNSTHERLWHSRKRRRRKRCRPDHLARAHLTALRRSQQQRETTNPPTTPRLLCRLYNLPVYLQRHLAANTCRDRLRRLALHYDDMTAFLALPGLLTLIFFSEFLQPRPGLWRAIGLFVRQR